MSDTPKDPDSKPRYEEIDLSDEDEAALDRAWEKLESVWNDLPEPDLDILRDASEEPKEPQRD